MIAEENSYYPLGLSTEIDFERRLAQRIAIEEAGFQAARGKAGKSNDKAALMSFMAMALIGVVLVMTLLFAIIAVSRMDLENKGAPQENGSSSEKSIQGEGGLWHSLSGTGHSL
jgi:hypothetical protein